MSISYWEKFASQRSSRRRTLSALGATALSTALLAACGGGDEGVKDQSGLLSKPADTSSKAVPGGVWQTVMGEPTTVDPSSSSQTPASQYYSILYSHLVKHGLTSDGSVPGSEAITGDAAESFEISGDGMQLTFKMRSSHKFDPRPPTNGRVLTAADVKYSWDRTAALSPFAGDWMHAKNPYAAIDSLSTPDDKTVIIKLAFPDSSILALLAYHAYFWIVPREADQFNIKAEARGSGPFFLKEWRPSLGMEYTKNPDWYEKGRPFLDGINGINLPDYPSALAQFEAGRLWDYGVNQEDVLRVKRAHPEMVMSRSLDDPEQGNVTHAMNVSSREDSPLRDQRLRQAASMVIDRDLVIATLYNTDGFREAGLPVQTYWANHLGGPFRVNWLDPKTNVIGDGQKFFQFNEAEAKKLMAAAGYDKSRPQLSYITRGTGISKLHTMLAEMLRAGGFNLDQQVLDTNTAWRQLCHLNDTVGTGWSGWCLNVTGGYDDVDALKSKYTPEGSFRLSYLPVPGVTDMIRKARAEPDVKKKNDLIKQVQRDLAMLWLDLPPPGYADSYQLNWPWLKNYGVFSEGGERRRSWSSSMVRKEYWYDASAKTV